MEMSRQKIIFNGYQKVCINYQSKFLQNSINNDAREPLKLKVCFSKKYIERENFKIKKIKINQK